MYRFLLVFGRVSRRKPFGLAMNCFNDPRQLVSGILRVSYVFIGIRILYSARK